MQDESHAASASLADKMKLPGGAGALYSQLQAHKAAGELESYEKRAAQLRA